MSVFVCAALSLTLAVHRPKIAVLDVQAVSSDQTEHAKVLTQLIAGEVSRERTLDVISSAQIRNMLGFEKQKALLGCSGGSCLAEIGGALGVDFLLTAQLSRIGSQLRLDLSLIDQAKAHAVATEGAFIPNTDDALRTGTLALVNALLVQGGLRDAAAAALSVHQAAPGAVSHRGAWASYGVAAVLLAAAGAMTAVTDSTYRGTVTYYSTTEPNAAKGSAPHAKDLSWMGPLTGGLYAGAVVAAGVGTLLYVTAAPSGPGAQVALRGSF